MSRRASQRPLAATGSARLVGIDLARFLAVVGMIVVHVEGDPFGWMTGLGMGNASTLFAVLGGVSVILATRRYLESGDVTAARWSVAGRAAVVILVGVALSFVDSPAVVVLVYFGVAIACIIPFIAAPTPALIVAASVLAIAGPVLNAFVRHELGIDSATTGTIGLDLFTDPLETAQGVLLTGQYPVVTWLVYLLVGMVLCRLLLAARRDGQERRFAVIMTGWGTLLAASAVVAAHGVASWSREERIATLPPGILESLPPGMTVDQLLSFPGQGSPSWTWWSLLSADAHTGTLLDIARGVGVAMAVIGLCLLITWMLPTVVMTALRPILSAGAAPLTIYSAHVVILWMLDLFALPVMEQTGEIAWWARGPEAVALQIAVALAIGAVLALLGRRGPLETLATAASKLAAKLGRSRTSQPSPAR